MVPLTNWQLTENTLGVLIQSLVREKREIPSKTGALTLHARQDHALINAIISRSRVGNGNHQKLVSSSLHLHDDHVYPVDLALAAQNPTLQELPGGVFGNKAAWGLELLRSLGFLGLNVLQALDLSWQGELVVYVSDSCQLCFRRQQVVPGGVVVL